MASRRSPVTLQIPDPPAPDPPIVPGFDLNAWLATRHEQEQHDTNGAPVWLDHAVAQEPDHVRTMNPEDWVEKRDRVRRLNDHRPKNSFDAPPPVYPVDLAVPSLSPAGERHTLPLEQRVLELVTKSSAGYTVASLSAMLGESNDILSSLLLRLVKRGKLDRTAGKGPKGGYAYHKKGVTPDVPKPTLPTTLDESIAFLETILTAEERETLAQAQNAKAIVRLHTTIGRKIRNDYNLWGKGSVFVEMMKRDHNLEHPDEISRFLMTEYADRQRKSVWERL